MFSSDSNRTLGLCNFDLAVLTPLKVSTLGVLGMVKKLYDTSTILALKSPLFIDSITNELQARLISNGDTIDPGANAEGSDSCAFV